jgi:hypothetical protein
MNPSSKSEGIENILIEILGVEILGIDTRECIKKDMCEISGFCQDGPTFEDSEDN